MESIEYPFGKEWPHFNHESFQESFEEHLERMKIFREAHDLADSRKSPGAPESLEILTALQLTGYVLNLIRERGTILLPRNWQN